MQARGVVRDTTCKHGIMSDPVLWAPCLPPMGLLGFKNVWLITNEQVRGNLYLLPLPERRTETQETGPCLYWERGQPTPLAMVRLYAWRRSTVSVL